MLARLALVVACLTTLLLHAAAQGLALKLVLADPIMGLFARIIATLEGLPLA